MSQSRRLAAILAADVAGYSRLMGTDEEGTLERLKALRRELVDPAIEEHNGRIVKTTGDGMLVEFGSVVDATRCAIQVQKAMAERNTAVPDESRIEFRVGINLGDVIIDGDDIYGDGVNIAARLEAMAEPGGISISGTVRDHLGERLDCTFEDLGEQSLKNIARPLRVYRVALTRLAPPARGTLSQTGEGQDGAVSPLSSNAGEGGEGRSPTPGEGSTATPLPLPDKPSIAVLPFQNMSGDPEQEYFADGMVEEIITALSRIRWLFVIARNSTFTYKGQPIDVKRVGRELGVRYVLEGSVRKGGGQLRITAQLIDAETGTHLWAERFDGSLEHVFDLQDQVATSVAGVIEPTLRAAETERSAKRLTSDLTAYDFYLRAPAAVFLSAKRIPDALGQLEQAIARDPDYGPALAMAACCCMRLIGDGSTADADGDRRKGVDFARRALQTARDDPGTLCNAALALAAFDEDIGAMLGLVDRALMLNPSFARGWYVSGLLLTWAGQPEVAIERIETSLRLSPRGRIGAPLNGLGFALLLSRRFEEAATKLLLAIQDEPDFPAPYRGLAACYAHMGRMEEAREIIARLRTVAPVFGGFGVRFRDPEQRQILLGGLRLAAGEAE